MGTGKSEVSRSNLKWVLEEGQGGKCTSAGAKRRLCGKGLDAAGNAGVKEQIFVPVTKGRDEWPKEEDVPKGRNAQKTRYEKRGSRGGGIVQTCTGVGTGRWALSGTEKTQA